MIPVASHAPSKVLGLTFHTLHNLACPSHVPVIRSVFATQCFAFFSLNGCEQVITISRADGYGRAGCILSSAKGHCSHKVLPG